MSAAQTVENNDLPPELREFLVELLDEILVADYWQAHGVTKKGG
jgi:hypothetical protein